MALIVQKYGGSSVADAARLRLVAERVAKSRAGGTDVVVVVSAMGDSTDDLLDLAAQVAPLPPARETDMLLSAGERISSALLAMALDALGVPACSLTGAQAGIATTADHGRAQITGVAPERVRQALDAGLVPVVAGFQGRADGGPEITTLGRGGSDTTAVALAAALDAELCEICTDVDGVYTADPRIVPDARRLDRIGYEAMRRLAAGGAQVLAAGSVAYAQRHRVPVRVRAAHGPGQGTLLCEDSGAPGGSVTGVTHHKAARITVAAPPGRGGAAGRILHAAAAAEGGFDIEVRQHDAGPGELSFVLHADHIPAVLAAIEDAGADAPDPVRVRCDDRIGSISVIGAAPSAGPGSVARCCSVLADAGVGIEAVTYLRPGVRVLCQDDHLCDAVRVLHSAFGLSAPAPAGA